MTADVTFADALHTLQSGRSIHFDALKQLPVTWYDVVKVSSLSPTLLLPHCCSSGHPTPSSDGLTRTGRRAVGAAADGGEPCPASASRPHAPTAGGSACSHGAAAGGETGLSALRQSQMDAQGALSRPSVRVQWRRVQNVLPRNRVLDVLASSERMVPEHESRVHPSLARCGVGH
jgi:hypothetical protein